MHYFVKALAAAALVAALATGPAAPARADDFSECTDGSVNVAIAACTRLIEGGRINGKDLATSYFNRGVNYDRKGQRGRALADYTRTIKLNPGAASAYHNRGVVYLDRRQYGRAIADLTRAIQLRPRKASSLAMRGIVYTKKGQYDRAIADFNKAIKLNPNFTVAYRNRGFAYWQKRQNRRAIADFRTAVRLDPKDDYSRKSLKSLGATP